MPDKLKEYITLVGLAFTMFLAGVGGVHMYNAERFEMQRCLAEADLKIARLEPRVDVLAKWLDLHRDMPSDIRDVQTIMARLEQRLIGIEKTVARNRDDYYHDHAEEYYRDYKETP
jgi:hypothetical protein